MRRVSTFLGGRSSTLSGLSGCGDTFLTCFGPLSRNRNFGLRLGKGERLKDILESTTEVAEGVETAMALAKLIKKSDKSFRSDLKYPIIFGVAQVLEGPCMHRGRGGWVSGCMGVAGGWGRVGRAAYGLEVCWVARVAHGAPHLPLLAFFRSRLRLRLPGKMTPEQGLNQIMTMPLRNEAYDFDFDE